MDKELLLTVKSEEVLKTINNLIVKGINGGEDRHGAYYFAWAGDLGTVKFIVQNEGGVNVTDKYGCTLLHWAALKGHSDIAKFLVDKGANVNAKDILGRTPMHFAVMNNHLGLVRLFTNARADINAKDNNDQTPLCVAIQYNRLDIINFLLGKDTNIEASDFNDNTVLKLAYCIKELMEKTNNNLPFDIEELKNKLPESVKNLVFASKVCITNVLFNEYLYATYGLYDQDRRTVYTWVPSSSNLSGSCGDDKQGMWKIQPYGDYVCITNVLFNEYLYATYGLYDQDRRTVYTWVPSSSNLSGSCGDDKQGMWKIQPYGDYVCITNVLFNEYLYATYGLYDQDRRTVYTWVPSSRSDPPGSCGNDKQGMWRIKDCSSVQKKRDTQELDSKVSLDSDSLEAIRAGNKSNGSQILALPDRLGDHLLGGSNQTGVGEFVSQVANTKGNKEKPLQRRRRHHHGDHARYHMLRKPLAIDQPKIAASSGTRPSSWINVFDWTRRSVSGLLGSKPVLPEGASSTTSPTLQVDAPIDVNGTIMLLDLLIRRFTGQKYISTVDQSISSLEAQGYALNIKKGFEKVVEQAGLKSGVSMHRLNIDYMGMQKEIIRKVMRGQFNEISGVLSSYLEKACPSREAGCPGKLSSKKFDKFMVEFHSGLLNQSIEQILHNGDGRLEVDGAKQMSLELQSYLSNASVQGHSKNKVSTCLSDIGVTKLVNNLSR